MKNLAPVTISVINYNDRKFIFQAIESAVKQTYANLEIIITDNLSTDGTREEIETKVAGWEEERRRISGDSETNNPSVIYVKNEENAGFGRPHNQAIRVGRGEFFLLLNSDALLQPNFVEEAIKAFEDPQVGSVQAKLLRYDFDKGELFKDIEDPSLNRIDTVGFRVYKNRRIVCIGQGSADRGQFDKKMEVFGVDGAVPTYRKTALESIKLPIWDRKDKKKMNEYEYFDEDFFMYKEDVDLAWRLRLAGWKAIYLPTAVAYHGRGSGDSMAKNYIKIIQERRKIGLRAKYFSFLHQRLMQIKDDSPSLLFTKHFFPFIIKEIGAWGYMAIFERFTFKLIKDFRRLVPVFVEKRKLVKERTKITDADIEKWFE
ncbi:MAG: glycosyltransferase family 2 protein [Candidatus Pacebacteria bacterium]|nr:glycosyltransferase family 2 protein [Candidatus Paceibacterota bacterium]